MTQLLTQIQVRNLGCFGESDYQMSLSPETLLVGPNNVGKSIMVGAYNFVRTLHLTNDWYNQWNTTSYHWGSLQNTANNHQPQKRVRAALNLSGPRYTGSVAVEFQGQNPQFTPPQQTNQALLEELRNGRYFALSRAEVQPNLHVSRLLGVSP